MSVHMPEARLCACRHACSRARTRRLRSVGRARCSSLPSADASFRRASPGLPTANAMDRNSSALDKRRVVQFFFSRASVAHPRGVDRRHAPRCESREASTLGPTAASRTACVCSCSTARRSLLYISYGTFVMAYWLWREGRCSILVTAYRLWHISYGILVMARRSLLRWRVQHPAPYTLHRTPFHPRKRKLCNR